MLLTISNYQYWLIYKPFKTISVYLILHGTNHIWSSDIQPIALQECSFYHSFDILF